MEQSGESSSENSGSSLQRSSENNRRSLNSLRSLLSRTVSNIEVEEIEPMEIISDSGSEETNTNEPTSLMQENASPYDGPKESFNTELPTEHLYMGQMDVVPGLRLFEAGKIYRIHVFEHHSILFPGETLPIIWSEYPFELASDSVEGLNFGVIFSDPKFERKVGVTCQVYERSVDSYKNIKLKCRAHQRFIVLKQDNGSFVVPINRSSNKQCLADILIQPEIELPHPLSLVAPGSLNRFLLNEKQLNIVSNHLCMLTRWPKFVYDLYDITHVLRKLKMLQLEAPSMNLVHLSFWLARNVAISEKKRFEIFIANNINHRLLVLGKALNTSNFFICKRCKNHLANYNEIVPMSKEGVQSSYCNENGYVHETLTFRRMIEDSSYLVDRPKTEFSWFPGYAWQILLCKSCSCHVGWRFTSTKKNLVPHTFYGLSRKSLTLSNKSSINSSTINEENTNSESDSDHSSFET